MKQLTKQEIIEIKAKAIINAIVKEQPQQYNYDTLSIEEKKGWCRIAEATIKADEDAGILILVDGEPKEGDFVLRDRNSDCYCCGMEFYAEHYSIYNNPKQVREIIQRNNIPVYNCKKEEK